MEAEGRTRKAARGVMEGGKEGSDGGTEGSEGGRRGARDEG